MTIANGKAPLSLLTALSTTGYLRADAAESYELMRTAALKAGVNLVPTSAHDAYRPYEVQERIFRQRYQTTFVQYRPGKVDRRRWQGKYWYRKPGTAAAATPGTSNHGLAVAVDFYGLGGFQGKGYKWLADNAAQYGWDNQEGRSVNEPWHWVYKPQNDKAPRPQPETKPEPTTEKPDMHVAHSNKAFALISGGRAIEISQGEYNNYKAAGALSVKLTDAKLATILKEWK